MTEQELMDAGREAVAQGDTATAARIREQLLAMRAETPAPSAPRGGFMQTIRDNLLGDDDDTTMNTGEKIGQFIENAGEAMTFGLLGDEAKAGMQSLRRGTSYDDELARNRQQEELFAELHPVADVAADVTGGLTGALAGGAALRAASLAPRAATWGANLLRNAIAGATGGATFGFMEGEGGAAARAGDAFSGAIVGGVGGAVLPETMRAVVSAARRAGVTGRTPVQQISRLLGIPPDVARQVSLALDDQALQEADTVAARLGDDFMLADTPGLAPVLDAAANASPRAAQTTLRALVDRAKIAGQEATDALDQTLGAPVGTAERIAGIRQNNAGTRSSQYDQAYNNPINYASGAGQALINRLQRVPQDVRAAARRLMDIEGQSSRQRMISINPDGSYSVRKLPDTREIDYMTRAMGDAAEATRGTGALRGMSSEGRAVSRLQAEIRRLLKRLNRDYAQAVGTARRDIRDIAAIEAGERALTANVTRSEFKRVLHGMTGRERKMVMAGARDFLDDTLARVRPTMLNPDTDVREAQKMVQLLGSREVVDKLRMLLPASEADQLISTMNRSATMMQLLAETAVNSKTAFRTALQQAMRDAMEPGAIGTLAQGRPVAATQRLVQEATGQTRHEVNMQMMRGFEALADTLVNKRGPEARKALAALRKAMSGEQFPTQEQIDVIVRGLTTGGVLASAPRGEEIIKATGRMVTP